MPYELTTSTPSLQPCAADIEASYDAEARIRKLPQAAIRLVHSLHGGVYTRTARVPAGVEFTSALILVPTTVIVHGDLLVLDRGVFVRFVGLQVLPASAYRRQVMRTIADTDITMIFPSRATSVVEAEQEFTDEWRLLGHHPDDIIINTHEEPPCQDGQQQPTSQPGPP